MCIQYTKDFILISYAHIFHKSLLWVNQYSSSNRPTACPTPKWRSQGNKYLSVHDKKKKTEFNTENVISQSQPWYHKVKFVLRTCKWGCLYQTYNLSFWGHMVGRENWLPMLAPPTHTHARAHTHACTHTSNINF